MLMHIINYIVRIMIMLIGVILAFGLYIPRSQDNTMMRVLGVVLILWGIYRIVTYRTRYNQMLRQQNEDNED